MRGILAVAGVAVLVSRALVPAPASASATETPQTETATAQPSPSVTGSGYFDGAINQAGAEAESVAEVPGGEAVSVSESAAARWTRLCGDTGISVYDPDQADSYTVRVDRIGDATGTVTEWSQTISRSGDHGHHQLGPSGTVTITGTGYGEYRTTCQANNSVHERFQVFHDATRTSPLQVRNHARALLSIPEPQPAGAPSLTDHYNYVNLPAWF